MDQLRDLRKHSRIQKEFSDFGLVLVNLKTDFAKLLKDYKYGANIVYTCFTFLCHHITDVGLYQQVFSYGKLNKRASQRIQGRQHGRGCHYWSNQKPKEKVNHDKKHANLWGY